MLKRSLFVATGALVIGAWPAPAQAQKDISPKLPNVLLLVDNSGSMEYLMEPTGKLPGDPSTTNTACDGTTGRSARNRWASLVTALTGTISDSDFSCRQVIRSGTAFNNEYSLGGVTPYDNGYYLPFHRIYSNGCAYGAGTLPGGTWDWWDLPSAHGGKNSTWRNTAGSAVGSCTTPWNQDPDGLLDAFRNLVRFGMMTVDTLPNAGTGSQATTPGAPGHPDWTTAAKGMWSYFHNWLPGAPGGNPSLSPDGNSINTGRPAAGNPAGCATPSWFEVGARNQAAPPWEGRLVPFGDWGSDANIGDTNDQIQEELLAMRPYGATPIAALLDDAEEFLFYDTTQVPGQTYLFGPSDDQFWINGCRQTFIILLSDGQPNMDMRSPKPGVCSGGHCASNGAACTKDVDCGLSGCDTGIPTGAPNVPGVCPYYLPDQIAGRMRNTPSNGQSVLTFVIGFTPSDFSRIWPNAGSIPAGLAGKSTCEQLDVTTTDCDNPPAELRACCNLQKIAYAGGTTHAYFADTSNKLKQALAAILSQVISGTTDRTWPVYAPATTPAAQGTAFQGNSSASYQFAASFVVNAPAAAVAHGAPSVGTLVPGLWNGRLYRERTSCPTSTGKPTVQAVDYSLGDDYGYNLDQSSASHPRKVLTAVGTIYQHGHGHDDDHDYKGNGNNTWINSDNTMRPFISADDGLGVYQPDPAAPSAPAPDATWVNTISGGWPEAFGMPDHASCAKAFGGGLNDQTCAAALLNWELGVPQALPSNVPQVTRIWGSCPLTCQNNQASSCPSKSPLCTCSCSKLGAIFHSTPAIATPPREFIRDDSYTTYATKTAVATQPTVLYTATMDGQLHAFKVQDNNASPTDTTDHAVNNELWTFIPPAVQQHLLPNYNTGGVALVDGAPIVVDLPGTPYVITNGDTPNLGRIGTATTDWHRVLLAGSGQAAAGGYYYALEVTDPTNPRFLWQIATDDRGNPLFGSSVPTPAVAIVNITIGTDTQQLPVAILPGGYTGATKDHCAPSSLSVSPVAATYSNMRNASTVNSHLLPGLTLSAPPLRCWDYKKNANRSSGNNLVVARVDTGEVLGFFLGDHYTGAPRNGNGGNSNDGEDEDDHGDKKNHFNNVFDAPFRAPLTGVPVVYPGQTGQVSDRVYVGDADGLLWRMDMSDPNIAHWKIELAWDAYATDTTAAANSHSNIREGIGVAPIVTRDNIGNPVILLATGDQDNFNVQETTNHVWSLTEESTKLTTANWHIALQTTGSRGGMRVTGPMALFNGVHYFATYQGAPGGSNICADGYGSVWAVDYVRRPTGATTGTAPGGLTPSATLWPLPQFPGNGNTLLWGQDGSAKTIIMGISVGETPTCDSTVISSDAYFGSHTALSGVSGSSYQVMWQTGAGSGISGNTNVQNDPIKGVQFIQPPSPGQGTRIDSWASIIE